MNKTKVNKVALCWSRSIDNIEFGELESFVMFQQDEIETDVGHRIDDVFVNNIDVKYNGQSINSGYG